MPACAKAVNDQGLSYSWYDGARVLLPRLTTMPLARLGIPFDHPDWIFELKYDGFRALAILEHGTIRLVSRNHNAFKAFPELCTALAASIEAESAVLDGEIVYLDTSGRPQFYDLMRRRCPQYFYAFDALWLNGRDLRGLSLLKRKRLLRAVIPPPTAPLLYVDHIDGHGEDLFRLVCEQDMEGIVAKKKDGLYTPDETSWVKIKSRSYSQAVGRHELFARKAGA